MGTKTIGIKESVYDRLAAAKRPGESFSDVIDRLLDEMAGDWRTGFGAYSEREATDLREAVERHRRETTTSHDDRQEDIQQGLRGDREGEP
jgi:predicted CopG family antitoxin